MQRTLNARLLSAVVALILSCVSVHGVHAASRVKAEQEVSESDVHQTAGQRMILGYVERVWFQAGAISVKAKLDTGAKTSSLDARNIEVFEKKGKRWVRFEFWTRDEETPFVTLERRVKRFVRIKRHTTKHQRRAVVELSFCVGGRPQRSEFTLIDRHKFIYPVLLGRKALKKNALVDPGSAFLGGYDCAPDAEPRP